MFLPKIYLTQFTQFGEPGLTPTVPVKSNRGLIIKIVVGIVFLATVGTGVSLATRIWDPLWNPFRPEPEEVLAEMFTNMAELETLHSKTTIGIVDTKEAFTMSITFEGDLDETDPENPKSHFNFDLAITAEGLKESISLKGESIAIGETFYIKLTTIDLPSEIESILMMFGIDLDKILNEIKEQWIVTEGTSEEQGEKTKELFTESKIYNVKKELKDEKINGKKAYHYLLALDKEETVKLIGELLRVSIEESEGIEAFSSSFLLGGMTESLNEFFEKVGEISFDFWIGKKDLFLYKVELEKEIEAEALGRGTEERMIIKFAMEFSGFDEPVTIEPPENFKGLEDVLLTPEGGFMGLFGQQQQQATEARILSDMYQMRVAAEMIYADENSYANVNCQNEIMKAICDDIKRIWMEPTIHQSKDKYCAYIQLIPETSLATGVKYYCVDSAGEALETSIYPGMSGYCDGTTFVCPSQ